MNSPLVLNALIDSSLDIELGTFALNIKKEVCGVIDYFLSFFTKYDERKAHNMLSFILDSKFKSLKLIYSFINHLQGWP
jgi:hypothetical protein